MGCACTCWVVVMFLGRSEPRAVVVASPGAGLTSELNKETKEYLCVLSHQLFYTICTDNAPPTRIGLFLMNGESPSDGH